MILLEPRIQGPALGSWRLYGAAGFSSPERRGSVLPLLSPLLELLVPVLVLAAAFGRAVAMSGRSWPCATRRGAEIGCISVISWGSGAWILDALCKPLGRLVGHWKQHQWEVLLYEPVLK